MKAILQGEFHTSSRDRESLDSRISGEVDALFIEQRNDSFRPDHWTIGYIAFVLGALSIFWVQAKLNDGPDPSENSRIPVHDRIDTPIPKLYSILPRSWKLGFGAISFAIFLGGVLTPEFHLGFLGAGSVLNTIYSMISKLAMTVGAPLIFSFLLISSEEKYLGRRDRDMAESITAVSRENGYSKVVVSCGNAHLESLKELLEQSGWEVKVYESNSTFLSDVY
jgi:hypothetical protein